MYLVEKTIFGTVALTRGALSKATIVETRNGLKDSQRISVHIVKGDEIANDEFPPAVMEDFRKRGIIVKDGKPTEDTDNNLTNVSGGKSLEANTSVRYGAKDGDKNPDSLKDIAEKV